MATRDLEGEERRRKVGERARVYIRRNDRGRQEMMPRGRDGTEINIVWVVKFKRRLCHSTFMKHFAATLINENNITLQSLCQLGPLAQSAIWTRTVFGSLE